jgi:hypothetical protein
MSERKGFSVEGPNFGFLYEPSKEDEVVMLFGLLMPHIGEFLEELGLGSRVFIDEWIESPTDCIMEVDGRKLRVEFELYSSNFIRRHDLKECDLIVCWMDNWKNPPGNVRILELKRVCERLAERGLRFIIKGEPKHPERGTPYTLEEFKEALRSRVGERDFKMLWSFVDEVSKLDGIGLQTGMGKKVPTLGIIIKKLEVCPLVLEATGRAYIVYYNVNAKPPKPLIPENLAKRIWRMLGEPKTKTGKMKEWHYLEASDTAELVEKLKEVVRVLLEA